MNKKAQYIDPLAENDYAVSPYAYCGNDPINRVDPWGLDWYWNTTTDKPVWFPGDGDRKGFRYHSATTEGMDEDYWYHYLSDGTVKKERREDPVEKNRGRGQWGAGLLPENNSGNPWDTDSGSSYGGSEISTNNLGNGVTVLGIMTSIGSETYYSKTFKTWMGKDYKIRSQNWGGNGATGGKNKYARKMSNKVKWGGRALGIANIGLIYNQYDGAQFLLEEGSNAYSTFGGIYGAAWAIGWETGRLITKQEWYQEWKYNFWYNYWENRLGAPAPYNEHSWYEYFYQYY